METSSQDEEQQSQEQERDAQHPRARQRERQEEAASRKKRSKTYGLGLGSLEDIQESQLIGVLAVHNTGPMDKVCPHCRALLLPGEPPRICCNKGDIVVEPRRPPPEDLCGGLFDEASIQQTRKYAKWINTHLAMASVASTEVREQGYNPTLKIEGRMYHRIGHSLLPGQGNKPKYVQVYFVDTADPYRELQARIAQFTEAEERDGGQVPADAREAHQQRRRRTMLAGDEETSRWLEQAIETFQTMLHTTNPYIRYMRSAVDLNPGRDLKILLKHDKARIPPGQHDRSWNLPAAGNGEVAAILTGEDVPTEKRDIVVHMRADEGGSNIKVIKLVS